MRKALVAGAVLTAALAGYLVAQPIAQNQFSGNECWNAGQGPGGPSTGFLCSAQVRNGTDLAVFSGAGAVVTQALFTNSTMMWTGTAPTTWAITLPSPSFDGQIVTVGTDTTLTTMVTVTAGAGQTLAAAFAAQTITAGTSVEFQFDQTLLKWFRLR